MVSRARGDLKRESISAALRSCYPDLVIRKKGVALVEETLVVQDQQDDADDTGDNEFEDVHQFLSDHNLGPEVESSQEAFAEDEVAEVLAASWKDRRAELNRLQKTRQFQKAKDIKRSFRVEIEDLKKQTTCNKCGRKGHWARECRTPMAKGSGKSASPSAPSGAAMVSDALDFVAMAAVKPSMLDTLRMKRADSQLVQDPTEVMLISSPGYGVLDSGCGRTILGKETFQEFIQLWSQQGVVIPDPVEEIHQFRYGNGHVETSTHSVCLPVWLAGKRGVIRAALVNGSAPLLISRSALKSLKASLDFQHDRLKIFDGVAIPLKSNSAGQYIVNLMDREAASDVQVSGFAEVMLTESKPELSPPLEPDVPEESGLKPPAEAILPPETDVPKDSPPRDQAAPAEPPSCWVQEDSGCQHIPWLSKEGPAWSLVCKRVVTDGISNRVLAVHDFCNNANQRATIHACVACQFRMCSHQVLSQRSPH